MSGRGMGRSAYNGMVRRGSRPRREAVIPFPIDCGQMMDAPMDAPMDATPPSLLDTLRTRRSTPAAKLSAPGPDAAALEDMLRIASRVPDHGKLAPWRFLVIQGDARTRLGETVEAAYVADNPGATDEQRAAERGRFARAPVVVAVVSRAAAHPKIPEWEQVLSAGAACQNLMLAAQAHGFGRTGSRNDRLTTGDILRRARPSRRHEHDSRPTSISARPRARMADRPRAGPSPDIVTRI